MRTAYVWISAWPAATIVHHLLVLAVFVAAFVRIRRTAGVELRILLLGLAALGLLTMPLSWVLLEQFHWGLVPQVQPMRALLFLTLGMQFFTAAAGAFAMAARRPAEAFIWFAFAYLLPLQPLLTGPFVWSRVNLAIALAAVTALAGIRWAPVVAFGAFFVIPALGGVVNYPQLHTPDLAELSAWARANTGRDAVFVFPGANRSLAPGIFRSEALRAVYADWKGGGQVNYLKDLGEQWWFRWRQIRDFKPGRPAAIHSFRDQLRSPAGTARPRGAIPERHVRRLPDQIMWHKLLTRPRHPSPHGRGTAHTGSKLLGRAGKCQDSPGGGSPDFFWPRSFAFVANPPPLNSRPRFRGQARSRAWRVAPSRVSFAHVSRRCHSSVARDCRLPPARSRRRTRLAGRGGRWRVDAPHALFRGGFRSPTRPRAEQVGLDSRSRAWTRFHSIGKRLLRSPHRVARRESGARPQIGRHDAVRQQHLQCGERPQYRRPQPQRGYPL